MESMEQKPEGLEQIDALAKKLDADILVFNFGVTRGRELELAELMRTRRRRKNVALILVTEGGDPDCAYKLARFLQTSYERFFCIISGYCKSAGTLIAIGAHELIFSPTGELGPIDVQLAKKDDLFDTQSGLTVMAALNSLESMAFTAFEKFFVDIERKSNNQITVRTATEVAAKLACGLYGPVLGQIDPMHVGEAQRASVIAMAYGDRLAGDSKNLKSRMLDWLSHGYPSHGFVIDFYEAKDIFENVRLTEDDEEDLLCRLGDLVRVPSRKGEMIYLSREAVHEEEASATKEQNPRVPGRATRKHAEAAVPDHARKNSQAEGL